MTHSLAVGADAPDFDLPVAGGGRTSLAALKGKAVVLYFYPKDDTPGCTKEAIAFNLLRSEFETAGATILGVSADSVASHDKFRKKHDLALDLAADEEKSMLEAYGVWREKSMYGRTFMGVARTTVLIGRDGRIAKVWENVKVDGHAEAVLEAVKAL